MNMRRTLEELLADSEQRAAFSADPEAALADAGFEGVTEALAGEALLQFAYCAPLEVAEALGPIVRLWSGVLDAEEADGSDPDGVALDGWAMLADLELPGSADDADAGDPTDFGAGDNTGGDSTDTAAGDNADTAAGENADGPEVDEPADFDAAELTIEEVNVDEMMGSDPVVDTEPGPFEQYGTIDSLDPDDLDLGDG